MGEALSASIAAKFRKKFRTGGFPSSSDYVWPSDYAFTYINKRLGRD